MTSTSRSTTPFVDLGLIAIGGVAVTLTVLWLPLWGLSHLLGSPEHPVGIEAVLRLVRDGGDVAAAAGAPVPTAAYWACVAVLGSAAVIVGVWVVRNRRGKGLISEDIDPHELPGGASRAAIKRSLSARSVLKTAHVLRPTTKVTRAEEIAFLLGISRGIPIYLPIEHSMVLVGPARMGKGFNVVLPFIVTAPGAVLSTSLRAENLVATVATRATTGPVAAFIPEGLASIGSAAAKVPTLARWSLTSGCQDPATAQRRAAALAANGASGTENASFWTTKCEQALAPLLMAAALGGGGTEALYGWAQSPARARGALDVLVEHPATPHGWAASLEAILDGSDHRTRANVWAQVEAVIVRPLMNPAVREAVSPSPGQDLNVEDFIARSGTMYVIAGEDAVASGIVAALIEDFYATAYRMANRSAGNRLDPPLHFSLDELANIAKLPSLPSMISAGGGAGISTLAVLQSLSQARERWGRDAANAIWGSATSRIILGGLTERDDLQAISELAGDYIEQRHSTNRQGLLADPGSFGTSEARERVLPNAQVRAMRRGTGLLISGAIPPVPVRFIPITKRKATP